MPVQSSLKKGYFQDQINKLIKEFGLSKEDIHVVVHEDDYISIKDKWIYFK